MSPDPFIGVVLEGRYRVDARIRSGGMCVVYRGFDQRLERLVAVKLAEERFQGDLRVAERFDFEARAIARIVDPGLVAVYDQGAVGSRPYLVLEHVAGGTVRALLTQRGAMPPYAAAAVLGPVLRALGAAHRAGLVHGDIKPENILVSTAGDVKITDFSGAGGDFAYAYGTAGYLAPEQVSRESQASSASDVYAAGLVLYELLTGALPSAGSTPGELPDARLAQDVPPPSRVIDGVPWQFDQLVLRATGREPAARYPDATSMAQELERVRAELGLPEYSVPTPTSPQVSSTGSLRGQPDHATVSLSAVLAAPAVLADPTTSLPVVAVDVVPGPPAGEDLPPSNTVSVGKAAVWFVAVLILGVAAVLVGWDLAAILEHELG